MPNRFEADISDTSLFCGMSPEQVVIHALWAKQWREEVIRQAELLDKRRTVGSNGLSCEDPDPMAMLDADMLLRD